MNASHATPPPPCHAEASDHLTHSPHTHQYKHHRVVAEDVDYLYGDGIAARHAETSLRILATSGGNSFSYAVLRSSSAAGNQR